MLSYLEDRELRNASQYSGVISLIWLHFVGEKVKDANQLALVN